MPKLQGSDTAATKKARTYATGGGDATASGVNFQQSLGAVFASWMLTESSIDHRLQLGAAKVVTIRMETEAPLDDVLVLTSERGVVAAQAKNSLSLSSSRDSEFGKTVDQVVRQWRLCRDGAGDLGWNRPLDESRDRLLIAVGPGSPATIRLHLARGLEARRQPGPAVLTAKETRALGQFDACVRLAWAAATTEPLADGILQAISHLTFVYVIDPDGVDRAALAASLGPALVNVADAPSVLNLLERIAGDLMSARAGREVPSLRRDLIDRGARLAVRPDYRDDIDALKTYSLQIGQTLSGLEVVEAEAGAPVGIARHCQPAVTTAALDGHLLLIGEPGAGKSAVINALGRALRAQGHDVVELAVDRFSVESLEGLSRTLRLRHDLPEVLGAWDGPGPAFLLIDALDAGRGGPAEAAFKRLIEAVIELDGRWTVVASIRTFDLRLGQSFRALFKGSPPDPALQGEGFGSVRHVQIPPWSPAEFDELISLSPRLAEVVRGSPAKLQELAMVPFNTRLLADLVAAGAVSQDFTAIDSQIALLNLYWERRIERHGMAAEVCLRAVVSEMVTHRTLRAPRLDVAASHAQALEELASEGVLVVTDQQRSIQFRHHLLFDYVASRVFLDAHAVVSGAMSFPKEGGNGLVLAPAMGFLLRGLWVEAPDHAQFWGAVSQLLGTPDCDPVIRSVAARMAAELPTQADDILSFARAIISGEVNATSALSHVAGAVVVRLEDEPSAPLAPWVRLALELSANPGPVAFVLRILGFLLISRVKDEELRGDLGAAMRALLRHGFTLDDSRNIATPTIGMVAETVATNLPASVSLLTEVLSDQRFDQFGVEELPALGQKIGVIARADPTFAAEIYRTAYTRDVSDTGKKSMGTGRILNLTTTPKQHFEMARWSLGEYFPKFLADAPAEATRAFLAAMQGYVQRRHPVPDELPAEVVSGPEGDVSLQPDHSHIWAHEAHPQYAEDAETLLSKSESFLETGEEAAVLAATRFAIEHASLAVVWSRLFMAAAVRGGALADLVAPYAKRMGFLVAPDTRKDAIDLVAAHYDHFPEAERRAFEADAADMDFGGFKYPEEAKQAFLERLFGTIGRERLATDAARAVVLYKPGSGEVNRRLFELTTRSITPATYHWLDESTRADPSVSAMIDAVDAVTATLHLELNDTQQPDDLADALAALSTLKGKLDAGIVTEPNLLRRAEGVFAQGVHKLVRSDLVSADLPAGVQDQLLDWIEYSLGSLHPEVDADTERQFESFASWGSPSARIDAAEAVLDVALKLPDQYARLEPSIDRVLAEPHPAVRLNAALRLVRICNIDREGFWRRAAEVVAKEPNRAVLDTFVTNTLSTLVSHEAARPVADLVLTLLDRLPSSDPRNEAVRGHAVQMTLQFWAQFGFAEAATRVEAWVAATIDNADEVREAIMWLRNAYTAGLRGDGDQEPAEHRPKAVALITAAVEQAARELGALEDLPALTDAQTVCAQRAVRIIDTACQQLYFSSGAFQNANQADQRPPMTQEGGRTFVRELAPVLRHVGEHGGPHTVYYLLQLLEHLVDADPAGIFDLIALAVLSGGRRGGYEYESLGADLLVKLVGRYLVDHKDVFGDPQRRTALVDSLEAFVVAGWPSVRRLLYRLPELLQ